jgi:SAM-dependent methyltransferase
MSVIQRIKDIVRARMNRLASARLKRFLWNREFSTGQWDKIENTPGDCVYPFIERYCQGGSILDLGCGTGNTSVELNFEKYRDYTGVDISDVAIRKAWERSEKAGRTAKNQYLQNDIESYVPDKKHNLILFRETLCYIPLSKVPRVLERYSQYLSPGGVFVVRLCDYEAYGKFIALVERDNHVLEKYLEPGTTTVVVIFNREGKAKELAPE